jgi:hypothetical protein
MNDLLVSLWGEDWPSYLAMLLLVALLSTVIKMVLKRSRLWRGFWLATKFSRESLLSAQNLLHLAKRRDYK